jgi:hypothetical protein
MTKKRTKDSLMIFFATILTIIALVYGFMTIPNPAKQRALTLDHQRVNDLGQLQYSIEDYYKQNNQLPKTLEILTQNMYSPSSQLTKTDPETNKLYDYTQTGSTTYQLCATFATDSLKEDTYDEKNYNYNSFRNKFQHPAGRYCFDQLVFSTKVNPLPNIWPTYIPVGSNPATIQPMQSQQ